MIKGGRFFAHGNPVPMGAELYEIGCLQAGSGEAPDRAWRRPRNQSSNRGAEVNISSLPEFVASVEAVEATPTTEDMRRIAWIRISSN